jgi:hypothetical protein
MRTSPQPLRAALFVLATASLGLACVLPDDPASKPCTADANCPQGYACNPEPSEDGKRHCALGYPPGLADAGSDAGTDGGADGGMFLPDERAREVSE